MSELKAYTYDDMLDGAADVDVEYYPKSEADKVIAKLKESVKELILDNYLKDKELRHQKYMRCLAMARWCMARYNEWYAYYPTTITRKMKILDKWKKRWRDLAEKFKPNSTINRKGGTNALQR